jgi:phenylpyruvate tautomerase PptA (4-oxalocrotonate tautomerase family)
MKLIYSPRITDGTIDTIALPSSSITIVVTDVGDE